MFVVIADEKVVSSHRKYARAVDSLNKVSNPLHADIVFECRYCYGLTSVHFATCPCCGAERS